MAIVSRGFRSRRREPDQRVPPGQYVTDDFPVLSAGPTPRIDTDRWSFELVTEHGERVSWSWRELMALPIDTFTVDIHCVTRWSKLATRWRGVSLDHLLTGVDTSALYAMVHSYGGYTTNVPLGRSARGQGLDRVRVRRSTAAGRARGTGPAAHPAPLLLEVGQVGPRAAPAGQRRAGVLGAQRLQPVRRPVDRGPVLLMATGTVPGLRLVGRQGRLGDRGHRARPGHRARRARLAG